MDNYGIWLKDVKILNTFLFWLFRWFKSPNIHLLVYKKANNDYFACTCVMFCACLDVWSTFAPVILCIKLSILRIYSILIVNSLVTKSDIVILLNLNMNVNSEYRPFPRLFEREKKLIKDNRLIMVTSDVRLVYITPISEIRVVHV